MKIQPIDSQTTPMFLNGAGPMPGEMVAAAQVDPDPNYPRQRVFVAVAAGGVRVEIALTPDQARTWAEALQRAAIAVDAALGADNPTVS